jgi:hypothetical protein
VSTERVWKVEAARLAKTHVARAPMAPVVLVAMADRAALEHRRRRAARTRTANGRMLAMIVMTAGRCAEARMGATIVMIAGRCAEARAGRSESALVDRRQIVADRRQIVVERRAAIAVGRRVAQVVAQAIVAGPRAAPRAAPRAGLAVVHQAIVVDRRAATLVRRAIVVDRLAAVRVHRAAVDVRQVVAVVRRRVVGAVRHRATVAVRGAEIGAARFTVAALIAGGGNAVSPPRGRFTARRAVGCAHA